jgi:hypothetical protein
VHAVRLRPEPSYWTHRTTNEDERRAKVLEAIRHLPRPIILYATKRVDAEAWDRDIGAAGFRRRALIHGGSSDEHRSDVLARWGRDEIDIMVANSAFGLGVDKPDVRAVVHVALPESIDRFYQDVGRGGRDGWGSLSLLLWDDRDKGAARRLAVPTFIGTDRGLERWKAMFFAPNRRVLGNDSYLLPLDVSPSVRSGDIDMDGDENRLWNLRTILLLARAGLIELAPGLSRNRDAETGSRNAVEIRVLDYRHLDSRAWEEKVAPRREAFLGASRESWDLMLSSLRHERCLSALLRQAYTDLPRGVSVSRACGGCHWCRVHGFPVRCGRMIAKHSPPTAWPETRIGQGLHDFIGTSKVGVIFFRASLPIDERKSQLRELARWLCDEGTVNIVATRMLLLEWASLFSQHADWRVFVQNGVPTTIARNQQSAVFVTDSQSTEWPELWRSLPDSIGRVVFILPDNIAEPDRPDRLLRDLFTGLPRLSYEQWEDRYLA